MWKTIKSRLVILRERSRYNRWKKDHPDASYDQYYVEKVNERLDSGEAHITLGKKQSDADWSMNSAAAELAYFIEQGLLPHHRVVDFGCGSLRLGKALMEYLEPGNYLGMDVTDRYFTEGQQHLEAGTRETKQPRFAVIDADSLAEATAWSPDFIVSTGVIMHVPTIELLPFLERILSLLSKPEANMYIAFRETPATVQVATMTWYYPGSELVELVKARGFEAKVVRVPKMEELIAAREPKGKGPYRLLRCRYSEQASN
jgi:2-polyprenyl-3-methyl-5-hydroxy-6-metoxy-1,4-benzoquinol methylase